jgi:hypothetical protein
MNHAIATAMLGSTSLADPEAIHEAWRTHVAKNNDERRLKMLDEARDVLLENVGSVLKNLWPATDQPSKKRKLLKDMPRMLLK